MWLPSAATSRPCFTSSGNVSRSWFAIRSHVVAGRPELRHETPNALTSAATSVCSDAWIVVRSTSPAKGNSGYDDNRDKRADYPHGLGVDEASPQLSSLCLLRISHDDLSPGVRRFVFVLNRHRVAGVSYVLGRICQSVQIAAKRYGFNTESSRLLLN